MMPTEEICARLDELGVEYDIYDLPNGEHGVSWIDGNNIEWEAVQQGENFRIHALQLVTSEQAIAATVSAGTCHMKLLENMHTSAYQDMYECDECGEQVLRETYMGKSEPPKFCPNCGRRCVG